MAQYAGRERLIQLTPNIGRKQTRNQQDRRKARLCLLMAFPWVARPATPPPPPPPLSWKHLAKNVVCALHCQCAAGSFLSQSHVCRSWSRTSHPTQLRALSVTSVLLQEQQPSCRITIVFGPEGWVGTTANKHTHTHTQNACTKNTAAGIVCMMEEEQML